MNLDDIADRVARFLHGSKPVRGRATTAGDVVNHPAKVSCPDCGDVWAAQEDMTLRLCAETHEYSYTYLCEACGKRTARTCTPQIAGFLLDKTCVVLAEWNLPLELFEAHVGPAFTSDELIDCWQLIWSEEFDTALQALTEGAS